MHDQPNTDNSEGAKMPSAHLTLKEEEVIRLVLEFLGNRELSISQLSLERETGVINGTYSDDVLFLRQLVLDGQWDDVLEFVQPMESIESFDAKQFRYIVTKHKYIELLCIRSEARSFHNIDVGVEEVVKCLSDLEKHCPTKEDYSNFCLLLTLPKLSDHAEYKNWNPSNARASCFKAIFPLIEKVLPADKKVVEAQKTSKGDRLIQLIIKGILYESCVEYCQQRATASVTDVHEMYFARLLNGTGFSDSDLSLLSWLQCIPPETFSYPFEQKSLNVDVEQLDKPCLEASWSEQILVAPIKPKIFPHSATPFTRLHTSDAMSKSLTPGLDAIGNGKNIMAFSMGDLASMSKSFLGFHLTGKKSMNTSVDRLFEEGDVFSASCCDLKVIMEAPPSTVDPEKPPLPPKSPERRAQLQFDDKNLGIKKPGIHDRLSPVEESKSITDSPKKVPAVAARQDTSAVADDSHPPDLWKMFQRQKQHVLEQSQALGSIPDNLPGTVPFQQTPPVNGELVCQDGATITPTILANQNRFARFEHLSTSTPKSLIGDVRNCEPQSSPVLPVNGCTTVQRQNLGAVPPKRLASVLDSANAMPQPGLLQAPVGMVDTPFRPRYANSSGDVAVVQPQPPLYGTMSTMSPYGGSFRTTLRDHLLDFYLSPALSQQCSLGTGFLSSGPHCLPVSG